MRPNAPDPHRPYLFAAQANTGHVHSCNGRNMNAVGGPRVEMATLHDPARLADAMQHPQAYLWPRVNDEPAMGGHIVWGESCLNRVHFDCIGFINYCMWRLLGAVHAPSILQLVQWWKRRYPQSHPERIDPFHLPYQTGDIILGPGDHHIAFAVNGSKIHAKSTHWGVVRENLTAPPGAENVRPTEEFLHAVFF